MKAQLVIFGFKVSAAMFLNNHLSHSYDKVSNRIIEERKDSLRMKMQLMTSHP